MSKGVQGWMLGGFKHPGVPVWLTDVATSGRLHPWLLLPTPTPNCSAPLWGLWPDPLVTPWGFPPGRGHAHTLTWAAARELAIGDDLTMTSSRGASQHALQRQLGWRWHCGSLQEGRAEGRWNTASRDTMATPLASFSLAFFSSHCTVALGTLSSFFPTHSLPAPSDLNSEDRTHAEMKSWPGWEGWRRALWPSWLSLCL